MNRVGMKVRLVVLIITLTTVEGEEYVTFSGDKVTLTCPVSEPTWLEKDGKAPENDKIDNGVLKTTFESDKGQEFSCKNEENEIYQYYFKGKGCKNCYEFNVGLVAIAIVGDLVFTGGVILVVYLLARKMSGPAAPQKSTSRSSGHAPAVPHPDYEPLRPGTRSKDIYATHRNG